MSQVGRHDSQRASGSVATTKGVCDVRFLACHCNSVSTITDTQPPLLQVMVAYQLYDLVTMFIYKDLFTIPMLVHHILAGILALNGLYNFMHGTPTVR
jgi:hypothetical protein